MQKPPFSKGPSLPASISCPVSLSANAPSHKTRLEQKRRRQPVCVCVCVSVSGCFRLLVCGLLPVCCSQQSGKSDLRGITALMENRDIWTITCVLKWSLPPHTRTHTHAVSKSKDKKTESQKQPELGTMKNKFYSLMELKSSVSCFSLSSWRR